MTKLSGLKKQKDNKKDKILLKKVLKKKGKKFKKGWIRTETPTEVVSSSCERHPLTSTFCGFLVLAPSTYRPPCSTTLSMCGAASSELPAAAAHVRPRSPLAFFHLDHKNTVALSWKEEAEAREEGVVKGEEKEEDKAESDSNSFSFSFRQTLSVARFVELKLVGIGGCPTDLGTLCRS